MSLSQASFCVFCHESPVKLLTCARCHTAQYCSKDCQKSDHKDHKTFCVLIAAKSRETDSALYQEAVRTQSPFAYNKAKENFEKKLHGHAWKQIPLWIHHSAFCLYLNLGLIRKAQEIHDFMTEFQKTHFQVPFMRQGNMIVQVPYHQEYALDYEARHVALMALKWKELFDKKKANFDDFKRALKKCEENSLEFRLAKELPALDRIKYFLYKKEFQWIENEIQRVYQKITQKDFDFDPDLVTSDLKDFFQRLLSCDHFPLLNEFFSRAVTKHGE